MEQNSPNPFNPPTSIQYGLPEESIVLLKIYDIVGREINTLITNEYENAGLKTVIRDGTDNHGNPVSSGMYFCTLDAYSLDVDGGQFHQKRKMVLLR